ncbi:restriction endonuclease subunit S [Acinetobacter pittii]|uniref:restriction endonuclease subunit S n=1 Tax=Acinetobacter pittii TaxID=48296 RepID=UPI001981AFF8|nr:restriction endonuclease subunit S [Acinetobacter pittii]
MEKQKSPKIRFKGFDQNWIEKNFGDFSSVQMCRRIFKSETKTKDEVPFFKIGTFGSIPDAFISRELYQEYIDKYPYPEIGDVLISASGTIGRTVIYKGESAYYQDSNIIWLKLDKSKISNNFLLPFYALMRWNNIEGSTIKRLYNSDLLSTKISYPILSEQESIGIFFQNLDQSIALQEKKFAQTQNLKKAMLERMFPKAGSKQPEIRLKGFSGDWVNSQLSNFISIKHGFAFDGAYFSEIETNLCLLTPGNFMIGGGFKAEKFIYYNGEVPENYILQENDLLVTMTDLSKESDTLGLPALLPLIRGKTLLHNQRLGLISFDKDELDKGFLFYLLQTESYHKYIVLSATGTTVKHTSPNKILAFVCDVPEFEEQKAIGQFFKQLDKTLVLQQQQLQTLKNLKQAFLEKMFV